MTLLPSMCKYKDIFGKPGEGIHKHRIFGFATVDLIATVVLSIIIGLMMRISPPKIFLFLIILSVFIHRLFCVDTALTRKIFGKN